jgi:hypothetical protein
LRDALRSRGWIEKFENMNPLPTIKRKSISKSRSKLNNAKEDDDDKDGDDINNGDDDGDNDDESKIKK